MTTPLLTSPLLRNVLAAASTMALAACAGGPPVPDWKMNAQGALERFQNAYLSGNALVETSEFRRARGQIAGTGKPELVARAELVRCAARVASLDFSACAGFEALRQDAAAPERAYADYLAGRIRAGDIAQLPEQHRAVASAASDTVAAAAVAAIADPLAQLVAAGVVFRSGRASPPLLITATDTASAQGWRRPLLAWLEVDALRARQAGDSAAADRIARRIALAQDSDN